ncbi:AraC family transcriptional regulator [Paenibacillus sp. N4]|uniref:AraC family transcriptional regulator n=1 Tax=Paenibacillus vietnamensis TaxID=2590547 RepID=UPI001CD0D15F|nr:AraC family transcriptional regulator [Paenibacillus vietnamensis]MCA0753441.1 AraC family transcriptional regulator [Paenibacillus vietnamensis]
METGSMKEYEYEYAEYLYATSPISDKENPIRIVRGGISDAKYNYRSGPKRIECISIHFVRQGSLVLEFKDQRLRLEAGDLFCLYPNVAYTYYRPKEEDADPLKLCWLAVDGSEAELMLKLSGFHPQHPIVRGGWSDQVEEGLNEIYKMLRERQFMTVYGHLDLRGRLYLLFALLIRQHGEPEATEPAGSVRLWAEYMERHAAEGITVQQVARMAGHNRTYFSTKFTNTFGMPPAEYIYKVRMNRAKELLIGEEASITEVAFSLGYPNLYTFSRAFTKYFAMSPSEYRRRYREEPL